MGKLNYETTEANAILENSKNHVENSEIHVSQSDKNNWNNKASPSDLLQPDWNQTDTSALDFIKNKPNVTRSATIKIAASNAYEKSKLAADFICDGVNDEAEIETALGVLASLGGGCIEFSEGTFNVNNNINVNVSNIWIKGQGFSTRLYGGVIFVIQSGVVVDMSNMFIDGIGIGIDNYGTVNLNRVRMQDGISQSIRNSNTVTLINCIIKGGIYNWTDSVKLTLIGNEIKTVSSPANKIKPSTADLLNQFNTITTLTLT